MEIDDAYRAWAHDSEILAEIGREMFLQPTKITVRIPRQLAEQARAAWERDYYEGPLPVEDNEQKKVRHRAGMLGLIGLSVQEGGTAEGDDVVVEVDAWYIGSALDAADEAGLLDGLIPPQG